MLPPAMTEVPLKTPLSFSSEKCFSLQCETKKSDNGIRRNRVSFEAYTHTFQGIHLQRQDIKFNLAKWKRTQKFYPPHFRCYILPR